MEKREKLLARIRANKKNVDPEDLQQLMEAYDFRSWTGKRGGHIVIFRHRVFQEITASMHPKQKPQRPCYVIQCLDAIDQVSEREEML